MNPVSRDLLHSCQAIVPGKACENFAVIRLSHINIGAHIKQITYQACQQITKTPCMGINIIGAVSRQLNDDRTPVEKLRKDMTKGDINGC